MPITLLYLNYPPELAPPRVTIGRHTYKFDPIEIGTIRPDLFQNGSFSIFDILVYLDSTGKIHLTSHFDATMNTYIIDSLNGENNWWHHVYYDGGNVEPNAVRLDHYPWKTGTTIILYQESISYINHVYSTFKEEITRLMSNNGTVIIPTISINGSSFNVEFYNVTVTPHNMRNDTLQFGVITALDVIMTLGDLGDITYELEFIKTLTGVKYIHDYWVTKINTDEIIGRCGFVNEQGDLDFKYPGPNYIYMTSDVRILNSPEYVSFFWKCL